MRIGKNELEIMEILARDDRGRMKRTTLRQRFKPDYNKESCKATAFSRALHSLAEKELIATYAEMSGTESGPWEFDGMGVDFYGNDAVLMKKPYDGRIGRAYGPNVNICLGLTEKGREEVGKRS